ncbi:MAG: hypothetical protein CL931_06440 [Deltaproteobacteria bacterium]|nr:hypothetical protein [Deltaproteobacteria bacterium]
MPRFGLGNQLRLILKNVGLFTGASLFSRVLALVLQGTLARLFGAEGLGAYATAVSIATYFTFLVDMGLSPRLVREGAVSPDELEEEFARAFGLKIVAGLAVLPLIATLYLTLPYDQEVRDLTVLVALGQVVMSFSYLFNSVCRAAERLDLEGAATLVHGLVFVGTSLTCLWMELPLISIGFASIAASIAQATLSASMAARFIRLRLDWRPHFGTLRAALPYATTSLTILAFTQIDILILSIIASQKLVGEYTSVSRLLLIAGTMAAIAGSAVLPTASRIYASQDRERFAEIVVGALGFVFLIGGAAATGLFVLADYLIQIVYGQDFASLSSLLQFGAIFMLLKFPVSASSILLTSSGRQSDRARSVIIGLFATVVFVLGLVPLLGLWGAVLAMVLSELATLICMLYHLRDHFRGAILARRFGTALFAVATAMACHVALANQSDTGAMHLFSIAAPLALFAAIVLGLGEVRRTLEFLGVIRA